MSCGRKSVPIKLGNQNRPTGNSFQRGMDRMTTGSSESASRSVPDGAGAARPAAARGDGGSRARLVKNCHTCL